MFRCVQVLLVAYLFVHVSGNTCPTDLTCSDCIAAGCSFGYSPHGTHSCGAGKGRQFVMRIRQIDSCKSLSDAPSMQQPNTPHFDSRVQSGEMESTVSSTTTSQLTSAHPTAHSLDAASIHVQHREQEDEEKQDFLMKLRRSNCVQYVILFKRIHRRRSADVELEKCNKKLGKAFV